MLCKCNHSCSPGASLSCPVREETESQVVKLISLSLFVFVALPITLRWDINGWIQMIYNGHFLYQVFRQCCLALILSLMKPGSLGAILPVLQVTRGGTDPLLAVYMVLQVLTTYLFTFVFPLCTVYPWALGELAFWLWEATILYTDKCYREKEGVGRQLKAFILRVVWTEMVGWILWRNRACLFFFFNIKSSWMLGVFKIGISVRKISLFC